MSDDALGRSLARDTGLITGFTLVSRLTGLVRIAVVAAVLGATALGDVYQGSNMVPTLLFELIAGGAIQAVLVPVFVRQLSSSRELGERSYRAVLGTLTMYAVAFTGLLALTAPLLARGIASGVEYGYDDRVRTATIFIIVFAPQLIFYAIGAVSTGMLQAQRMFKAGAIAPVVNNIVVITIYLLFAASVSGAPTLAEATWKMLLLSAGTTLAVLSFTSVPLWFVSRTMSIRPCIDRNDPAVSAVGHVGRWAFLQIACSLVPSVAAVVIGARNDGGVAIFSYAYAVFLLPFSLIASPVATAMLPRLSLHNHRGEYHIASRLFNGALRPAVIALGFASLAMVSLGRPIATVLAFGQMNGSGLDNYALALRWIGVGILGYGVWFVCIRAMFAMEMVRRAALVTLFSSVVCVVAMLIGVSVFEGTHSSVVLAGAISVGYSVAALLAYVCRPEPLRADSLVSRLNGALSVVVGLTVFSLLAIGADALVSPHGRMKCIAFLVLVALVAPPLGVAAALLVWRPRVGHTGDRIVLVVGPSEGGIRRHVVSLAEELSERGRKVEVWAPQSVTSFVERTSPGLSSSVVEIPSGWSPRAWWRAVRSIRALEDPDTLLHCHGLKPALAVLLAGRSPVVTWHNKVIMATHGVKSMPLVLLERAVLRRSAFVVATTSAMDHQLAHWGVPAASRAVVRPSHRVPEPKRHRGELGVNDGPLIVCVARLHRQKGVDVLIDAVHLRNAELRAAGAQVVIVGDGPDREALQEAAADCKDMVRFAGSDDDAVSWIKAADLVVIPSRWESGPLVALEARAFGRPWIGTRTGFMPDFESDDSCTIVNPDDAAAMGEAMVELLGGTASHFESTAMVSDLLASTTAIESIYARLRTTLRSGFAARPKSRTLILALALAITALGIQVSKPRFADLAPLSRPTSAVIVSVPTLEWMDVKNFDMSSVTSFTMRSSLSIRTIGARTSLYEAYVSAGSGNRAAISLATHPLLLPPLGGCSPLLHDAAQIDADKKLYEADPGVLGQTLSDAGVARSVYGSTPALTMLMDDFGCVDHFTLGVPTVGAVVDGLAAGNQVKLVELGQMQKLWDTANPDTRPSEPVVPDLGAMQAAAKEIDQWVGDLLARVPGNTAVYLLAPVSHPGRSNLSVFAISREGQAGTLQSGTTRREGFVTIPDIAPTLLEQFEAKIPESINGTSITVTEHAKADAIGNLITDSERTTARNLAVGPVSVVFVVLQVILYLAAAMLVFGRRRLGVLPLQMGMVLIPMVPLVVFLAGGLSLHKLSSIQVTMAIYAVALLASASLVFARRTSIAHAVVAIVAANWLVQVVDIALGGRLQINTVFGYSATVAGRFQGFGNLAFSLLAVSGLVVAAIPVLMGRGVLDFSTRQWVAFIGFVTLVADGFPWFGADVGGVLAIVPAFGVLWLMAEGGRINLKKLAAVCGVGVFVLAGLAAFDLSRPESAQTHLGRFARKLVNGDAGTVIKRKLSANTHMLTSSVWTWLVPIVALFFVVLMFRSNGALRRARTAISGLDALIISATVLGVLGFAVNDSGVVIPSMMFGVLVPLTLALLVRMEQEGGA